MIFVYGYDANSRLTSRTTPAKGTTSYSCDNVGNLLSVTYPHSPSISFLYDGLDRMTNMVDAVGTTAFTWTPGNQLASEDGPWDDDTVSYIYSSNRLRLAVSVAGPSSGPWTQGYLYDGLARLTNVTSPAGVFNYTYASVSGDLVQDVEMPSTTLYAQNTYDGLGRLSGTALHTPINYTANTY